MITSLVRPAARRFAVTVHAPTDVSLRQHAIVSDVGVSVWRRSSATRPWGDSNAATTEESRWQTELQASLHMSLGLECQILVGRRVGMPRDQAESRLGDSWADAIQDAEPPVRREHRLLLQELLRPLKCRLAPVAVRVGGLLGEEPVDVRVAAVDIRATRRHERFQPRRRVPEGAAADLHDIPQLL